MRSWCVILSAVVLAILGPARSMGAGDNVVRRAAFDIGSSNIKCTVADVDIITGTLIKTVADFSRKVDFAESLARSYDGNIDTDTMKRGQIAMEELHQEALKLQAHQFSAVGGDCFRAARNGRAYFVTLQHTLGFSCRLVSKQQASLLNYHAVRLMTDIPESSLLIWDIGGDSQRMTCRNRDNSIDFYMDSLASVTFKNAVIMAIQGREIESKGSPNPMDAKQVEEALRYAKAHAEMEMPPKLVERLRTGGMKVIGIGGVHYHAIPEMLGIGTVPYTRQQVADAIARWTGKTDMELSSEYAATRLTDLILVQAYMEAMHTTEVIPLQCNEAHGLLVSPEYW
ncbi:hypothetical protein [Pseudodesulfovibrio sp.]|uniref:Ppx/GppA phosphatase family protein n=1 Tax=unclassified Pseudodesulfovibrio TaxID=2661612 RepID=UPI003B00839F